MELLPALYFITKIIWGVVFAGLIAIFGRVVDSYVKDKKTPWNYWIAPFSLFAFGFISSAVFSALYTALETWPIKFNMNPFLTISFIGYTSTGIMIALVGAITHHYIKEIHSTEEKEFEIEVSQLNIIDPGIYNYFVIVDKKIDGKVTSSSINMNNKTLLIIDDQID